MNGYERRKLERARLAAARRSVAAENRSVEVHKALQRYEQAYFDFHRAVVRVRYVNGWCLVHNRRVRVAQLEEMTKNLYGKLHEMELNTPEQSL